MYRQKRNQSENALVATMKGALGAAGVATAAIAAGHPEAALITTVAPYLMPVMQEYFGMVLPQKRLDRVETMLHYLMAKNAQVSPETLQSKLDNDEAFAAIFERGVIQASNASTAQTKLRLESIAGIVATQYRNSAKALAADKCLSMVADLDDLDLYLLLKIPAYFGLGIDKDEDQITFSSSALRQHTEKWFLGQERSLKEALQDINDDQRSSEIIAYGSMGEHSMKRMENFGLVHLHENSGPYQKGWSLSRFGGLLVDYIDGLQTDHPDNDH